MNDFEPAPCSRGSGKYAREQCVLDHAVLRLKMINDDPSCSDKEYATLVAEYDLLLQQTRNASSLADSLNQKIFELQDLMHQDALTGIHNRRYLDDNLDRIVKTLCRCGGELGVLMVDVDLFKQYNDIYGHGMGDTSLRKVAATLEQSLTRADDFVARYGGEEFSVILPNTGECGVRLVAERILINVRGCNIPYEYSDVAPCVTVSVGATSGMVTPHRCGDDFIKLADEALYRAKSRGRNISVFQNF